jgi:hypothetical protein
LHQIKLLRLVFVKIAVAGHSDFLAWTLLAALEAALNTKWTCQPKPNGIPVKRWYFHGETHTREAFIVSSVPSPEGKETPLDMRPPFRSASSSLVKTRLIRRIVEPSFFLLSCCFRCLRPWLQRH